MEKKKKNTTLYVNKWLVIGINKKKLFFSCQQGKESLKLEIFMLFSPKDLCECGYTYVCMQLNL